MGAGRSWRCTPCARRRTRHPRGSGSRLAPGRGDAPSRPSPCCPPPSRGQVIPTTKGPRRKPSAQRIRLTLAVRLPIAQIALLEGAGARGVNGTLRASVLPSPGCGRVSRPSTHARLGRTGDVRPTAGFVPALVRGRRRDAPSRAHGSLCRCDGEDSSCSDGRMPSPSRTSCRPRRTRAHQAQMRAPESGPRRACSGRTPSVSASERLTLASARPSDSAASSGARRLEVVRGERRARSAMCSCLPCQTERLSATVARPLLCGWRGWRLSRLLRLPRSPAHTRARSVPSSAPCCWRDGCLRRPRHGRGRSRQSPRSR